VKTINEKIASKTWIKMKSKINERNFNQKQKQRTHFPYEMGP
jgi:hypothetical protein